MWVRMQIKKDKTKALVTAIKTPIEYYSKGSKHILSAIQAHVKDISELANSMDFDEERVKNSTNYCDGIAAKPTTYTLTIEVTNKHYTDNFDQTTKGTIATAPPRISLASSR